MRLFGLIGYPLAQSFSKKFFDKKFEKEQLTDCRFENFPISSIDAFPILLKENKDLIGLAVTIPYKKLVLKYLDNTNGLPEGLQACNCIRIEDGKLYGFNTDHIGFEKSLLPLLKPHHQQALILGNGGAAEAVAFSLKELNVGFNVVSRQLHQGSSLTYEELNESIIKEHTLIINTTPLGMYPNVSEAPPIPYQFIRHYHLMYDLVYNPDKTLFLQKGEERGAVVKNGYEMLVLQAEENWKVWNA